MTETAQMRLEQPELSVAARYEALIRVSQAVGVHREPKKLFEVLAGELRRVIEFDGFGVAQYDESSGKIQWHVSVRCNERVLGKTIHDVLGVRTPAAHHHPGCGY
jgi:formate hydrogenlyase transcriptional activator